MAFIGFDLMETQAFMKALRKHGEEEIYLKISKDIFKESTATIKLHKVSNKIPIKKRIRQSDSLS